MLGRGTAAAAQNSDAHIVQPLHLSGKILGIALINSPAAQHRGIACIGHHRQRLFHRAQLLHQRNHMSGSGHTVQTYCVHCGISLRLMNQMGCQLSGAGKSVGLRCKGGDNKRLRLPLSNIFCNFSNTGKAAECLKQEVFRAQLQEHIHREPVFLQRPFCIGHGHRTNIRKDKGISGCLCGNVPACFYDPSTGFLSQRQPICTKGVCLDGVAPGRQIGFVHLCHLLRRIQIGGFAAVGRAVILCHEITSHGTVKNQRMLL